MLRVWLTFQHWSNCVPMFVFITPLPLASVAGMLHADWHLSRHAKRVQMLSNARLWRRPAWVAFIRALFYKGLWPNKLLFMAAGMSCVGQSNMTQLYMEVVDMDFLNFASLKEAAAFAKALLL